MALFDTSPTPFVDNDLSIGIGHTEFDLTATGTLLLAMPVVLFGFAVQNGSGSAAVQLDIYDASGVAGTPVFPVNLAANETTREWFGDRGLLFRNGIYLNVPSGEVKGSVFFVAMSGLTGGAG